MIANSIWQRKFGGLIIGLEGVITKLNLYDHEYYPYFLRSRQKLSMKNLVENFYVVLFRTERI